MLARLSLQFAWLVLVLFGLSAWRLWARQSLDLELFFDEAYYWGWAQELAWGYYSKPPMVAWLISCSTRLLGDSEFAIRLWASILYPACALVIYAIGRRLFAEDKHVALMGAICFATLPVVGFGTWFMTTDAPLLFFWAVALLCYVIALQSNLWRHWLALGLALGLGMLSKYSMVFFVFAMVVHLLMTGQLWQCMRNPKPYVAGCLTLAVLAPNLWWNWAHDFSSYRHTAEISQLDRAGFNLQNLLTFVAAQFGLFGVLFLGGLLLAARRAEPIWRNRSLTLLACFSFTPLVLFSILAFSSRAFANWAAFSYVAAALLIAALWKEPHRKPWLVTGIILNLLLLVLLCHWHSITSALGVTLTAKTDPYVRVTGWRNLGTQLVPYLQAHPDAKLLGDSREALAQMNYYAGRSAPNALKPVFYNPSGRINNHYALTSDLKNHSQGAFLWVSSMDLATLAPQVFAKTEYLASLSSPLYPNYQRVLHVWLVSDYLGQGALSTHE